MYIINSYKPQEIGICILIVKGGKNESCNILAILIRVIYNN